MTSKTRGHGGCRRRFFAAPATAGERGRNGSVASSPTKCSQCIGCGTEIVHKRRRGRRRLRCRTGCGRRGRRRSRSTLAGYIKRLTRIDLCSCGRTFDPWRHGSGRASTCGQCVGTRSAIRSVLRRARRELPPRRCRLCLVEFEPTTPNQVYCCEPHNNIAKSKRRKALKRGAARGAVPSLWTIYARDRGRCQLCRGRVGRKFKWPHPRTASLDHIVPISQGGTDEARNLQLAHLGCNMAKQTRVCGSQLLLFG